MVGKRVPMVACAHGPTVQCRYQQSIEQANEGRASHMSKTVFVITTISRPWRIIGIDARGSPRMCVVNETLLLGRQVAQIEPDQERETTKADKIQRWVGHRTHIVFIGALALGCSLSTMTKDGPIEEAGDVSTTARLRDGRNTRQRLRE